MTNQNRLASLVAAGQATEADMEALGLDAVKLVKTCPEALQFRGRGYDIITKNESKRQITYLVSDETPDRMGDIIQVKGWDLGAYKKNPVILWSHDGSSVPPIGRAVNIRRRYSDSPRLTADVEFAPKEAYEFADTIYQLASRGFIKATSVGFLPKETQEVDDAERKKLGLGKYGQLFSRTELMEISVVAVPANPAALELGMKALMSEGAIEKALAARFFDEYPKDEESALKKIRAVCRSFVDFGALFSAPATKDTPEGAYNEEDPVELAIPEALDPELEEKSPACRQEGETHEECVERKIPELVEDEGMEQDQAVAVANSVCDEACDEKNLESQTAFVNSMAWLIEQQAEQTKATRQLVDALTDLTRHIHSHSRDGVQSSGSVSEPEAATPEVTEMSVEELDSVIEGRIRGFADGLRRDLKLSNKPQNR